jgi:acyl carrier protein
MELKDFVIKFAELFEKTETSAFSPETRFKELDEWSSLVALYIISMVDEEYNLILKGDDIKNAITVNDLFNALQSRI